MGINKPSGAAQHASAGKCGGPDCAQRIPVAARRHITWKKYCSSTCANRARNERYWTKRFGLDLRRK